MDLCGATHRTCCCREDQHFFVRLVDYNVSTAVFILRYDRVQMKTIVASFKVPSLDLSARSEENH